MAKEKELQDLQRKEDAATDPDTKRALAYVMEVAVDALKGRFQRDDLPGLKKYVLLERRRVAIELGWYSRDQAATIQSIWSHCHFRGSRNRTKRCSLHNRQPFHSSVLKYPAKQAPQRREPRREANCNGCQNGGALQISFPQVNKANIEHLH